MSSNPQQFLSNGNYQKVVEFLRQHYATRMGLTAIPERLDSRIQKTTQHYMTEIAKTHGNQPAYTLNQEVLRETSTSIDMWLRKSDTTSAVATGPPAAIKTRPVVAAATAAPKPKPRPTTVNQVIPSYNDINSIFDAKTPSPQNLLSPDFDYASASMEEEDPIVLMKRAQKLRDDEFRTMNPSTSNTPKMEITEIVDPTPQVAPPPAREVPLPQDYIIPQEDVVKYRETEYNIFLTSSDRDWMRSKGENRYNFSVNFNPGNRSGYGLSPSVQERFRNIQRIEFVKSLLPTESLTTLVRSTAITPAIVNNTDRIINVFSLPFVGIRIAELNNNGFSTNPREDNTFAIVQYDSTWNSDTSRTSANPSKGNVGYTGFIPKFLKCQRVYEPTPLTTLQKLTIRMERHDGALLSDDSDVMNIQRICLSSLTTGIDNTNSSLYAQADNQYIFIQTSSYFPFSAFSEGDLINIQGYAVAATGTSTPPPSTNTMMDFNSYINSATGHNIVAIGYMDADATNTITDGSNKQGYSNIIILRSRFNDPTTGSTGRSYFGGSDTEEGYLEARINDQPASTSSAALINLSRQTHMVLRVITREMDASSNIRPDNV